NKIPFEKKLNIIASNGYFSKKQEQYKNSNIAIVKLMSDKSIKDWKLDEIRERNIKIVDEVVSIFNLWDIEYTHESDNLTDEEIAAIELIKNKGLEKYL
ncbi:MAG: DUF1524 domain-containing protein, partial [Erysipelotrichaceae bacterium]|nr:DUF1524 domain-containing protein [Erysipelotrichaceae bacterium]